MDYLGDMLVKTLTVGTMILAIWALVDAVMRPTPSYVAAGKLTKPAWCAILGLGLACQFLFVSPLNFINLAFTIGALVYLADVRPALRQVRGIGGRSNTGW